MPTLTLTSKRQATFPARMCEDLNLRPGDVIEVEPAQLSGERVWVLRPRKTPPRPWLGSLSLKTAATDHTMESVRASIARKRSGTDA
jgi:bifunctional DNA-binding transcriptional regulator/antitoxin component of YhaV-PrlF toxin-antitoxin module